MGADATCELELAAAAVNVARVCAGRGGRWPEHRTAVAGANAHGEGALCRRVGCELCFRTKNLAYDSTYRTHASQWLVGAVKEVINPVALVPDNEVHRHVCAVQTCGPWDSWDPLCQ